MNNAWTSIALRVHNTAPRTRPAPLLQLFNGYAKSHSSRSFVQWSTLSSGQKRSQGLSYSNARSNGEPTFSTSSCLNARPKKPTGPKSKSKAKETSKHPITQTKAQKLQTTTKNDSRLQPAQTVASHTEGLPAASPEKQLTWRDYDPVGGMPLPGGELSQPEINAIFNGEEVDVDTGNYILSVIHWRRISGALIDAGLDFPKDSGVTQEQALMGLTYVRSVLPDVDEEQNGQVWAEEEQNRLREEIQARAVKLGLYKAQPGEELDQEDQLESEESQQGTAEGRKRNQDSVLIQTRKAKESEFEKWQAQQVIREEQTRRVAAHIARGPLELMGGVVPIVSSVQLSTEVKGPFGLSFKVPKEVNIGPPQVKAYLPPVERKTWVKYYEEQATIIKDNNIPQMSTLARLGPSFLVLLGVLAGCYYLSENYTPPPKSARVWPETPPAVSTMYALTGVLFAFFIMGRIPPLWRTFNKYMTIVPAYPFAMSLIGATFRHDTLNHLLGNTICLWLFGLMLHDDVGRGTFLAIYLASGVGGAYVSLVYNVLRKNWTAYIFGSSGSVMGVISAACVLHPNGKFNVLGYDVPIAAWVFLAFITGAEGVAAIRGMKTTIDHAGHLGGIAFAAVMALGLRMRAEKKQRGSGDGQVKSVEGVDEVVEEKVEGAVAAIRA